ncbi:MAG TPA: histidine kinase, partial [Candidatus Dormibacteraeota bacterium]|nr:histidine kinase [Candidatus Dormibacteraeota bacterium]
STHVALLRARSEAIRDERSRLARDIHDSLLQGFGGIALQLQAASERLALPPSQQPLLDRVLALVDSTLTQARKAVWDIRLPGVASVDLAADVEATARRIFADSTTEARIVTRGRKRQVSVSCQAEYLRIVEEALANVRKHAQAAHVVLEIAYGWRRVRLTIRDDGKGFDVDREGKRPGHWGLLGMRERASRMGARFTLESRLGSGTVIAIVGPYRLGVRTRVTSAIRKD